jgi:hypothetical protein
VEGDGVETIDPVSSEAPNGGRRWKTVHLALAAVVSLILGIAIGAGAGSAGDEENIEAADPTTTTADDDTQEEPERSTTTQRPTTSTTQKPAKVGTRRNPLPLGQTATLSDADGPVWNVTVVGFTPNANADVERANQFNDPPPPGRQFAMFRLRAEFVGSDEPSQFGGELTVKALDDTNVTYDYEDNCGVIPEGLDEYGDVYKGGVIEGNMCFSVESAQISTLLLILEESFSFDSEPYFLALQ